MNSNIKLEQYILSCMVENKQCAEEVDTLSEEDFTDAENKQIYIAIKDLVRNQKKFDSMILIQHIGKTVGMNALEFLATTQTISANFKEYVIKLQDLTTKRKLHSLAEKILTSKATGEDMSEEVEKEIFKIRENIQTEDFEDMQDIVLSVLNEIESIQTSKGTTGLETGFKYLDQLTDGLQNSNYILLGARPSMGKTALALNIVSKVALKGKKVALFSLEMSKTQVVKRMLLSESNVSDEKVKAKRLTDKDYQRLSAIGSLISKSHIYINDNGSLTVAQMKSMCRKRKRTSGLDLVVVDYLQLIRCKGGGQRREQVEAVSRDLKVMCKELNVPVLVISSLSRANEVRSDKRPILSDLRETGQIEFDADLIMFLHREHYYDHEANPNTAELIIAKARNGSLGVINLGWNGGCTEFSNLG